MPWSVARVVLLTAFVFVLAAAPALAAPFTVDSTVDAVDATPGDGACATASAACTLRAAVQEANALAGADEIAIPAGTYRLTITGAGEDAAATGDLDVTSDLTITGAGGRLVTISAQVSGDLNANRVDRVFDVIAGGSLSLAKLTVRDGNGHPGGNIRAAGPLSLTDATVSDAFGGDGSGVWSSAPLDLNRVTVTGNRGSAHGGGVAVSAALTAVNTTIYGNDGSRGGGLDVLPGGSADLTNVTIALNNGQDAGGQIFNAGAIQLRNSIIERTVPAAVNCGGTAPVSGGHNVDDDGSCQLSATGDRGFDFFTWTSYVLVNSGGDTDVLPNYDPHVFGFPTYPAPGPAVDIGGSGCPATDQRGLARPQGQSCDAGAYEASFADLVVTQTGFPEQVIGGETIHYTVVVRNDGPTTSATPQLSLAQTVLGPPPIQSIGGSPCQYFSCDLGPLLPGASATIAIEQPTSAVDQPKTATVTWSTYDGSDASHESIDPNAENSAVHLSVNVLPRPHSDTFKPQSPPAKPCSVRKTGTRRNDVLKGTAGPDLLRGLAGNDKLKGLAGDDCLDGGAGNDVLTGGTGKDKLTGGNGADTINAADHAKDTVDCGKGRDRATVDRIDRVRHCEKVTRKH